MSITTSLEHYKMFVGGEWTPASSADGTFLTENPYTGQPWAQVPDAGADDVDRAVRAAHEALRGPWGTMTGFERSAALHRLADLVERDADHLGVIESRDNGKLQREMVGQMRRMPSWLRYFAGVADKLQGDTIPSENPNFFVYTRYEPVGVVAAIIPWNSPLLLTMWKLAPALAAGCTFVLKPSEYTPVSALELAALFDEAEFPPGVFNVVTGQGAEVGETLVQHELVDKVAFTGSTRTGIQVAKGAVEHLARVSLELGGKSAQVVFGDADLEHVVNGVVAGIFAATGQTCIAGSRLLLHSSVHDAVVERLKERSERIRLGDPSHADTDMGPLANRTQWQTVTGFIERAREAGATIACGDGPSAHGGLFVDPTIITNVRPDMEIAQEEVFGPVLAVMRFDDEEEAIALANSTRYGLAASVWTNDVRRAHRVAHRLEAGTVWVNSYRVVAPNAPFGGVGISGWGRESGLAAVTEYTETKTVWIEIANATRDPFVLG